MVTAYQIKLLRHACGMDSNRPYFRNHFAAAPGFEDDEHWVAMVKLGVAEKLEHSEIFVDNMYIVTEKGKAIVERHAKRGTT